MMAHIKETLVNGDVCAESWEELELSRQKSKVMAKGKILGDYKAGIQVGQGAKKM